MKIENDSAILPSHDNDQIEERAYKRGNGGKNSNN